MPYDHREHTVEENLEMARTLGDHIGVRDASHPSLVDANLSVHFITTGMKCPLCLEAAVDGAYEMRKS